MHLRPTHPTPREQTLNSTIKHRSKGATSVQVPLHYASQPPTPPCVPAMGCTPLTPLPRALPARPPWPLRPRASSPHTPAAKPRPVRSRHRPGLFLVWAGALAWWAVFSTEGNRRHARRGVGNGRVGGGALQVLTHRPPVGWSLLGLEAKGRITKPTVWRAP